MSHNLTRYFLHALRLAPTFVFPLLVAMPGQYALATADGCTGFSPRTCINVTGEGLKLNSVVGSFKKATRLCNWRYDIVYTDTNGKNYNTVKGRTTSGCDFSGSSSVTPPKSVRTGKVCARLYENGSYVNAACVNLFR